MVISCVRRRLLTSSGNGRSVRGRVEPEREDVSSAEDKRPHRHGTIPPLRPSGAGDKWLFIISIIIIISVIIKACD